MKPCTCSQSILAHICQPHAHTHACIHTSNVLPSLVLEDLPPVNLAMISFPLRALTMPVAANTATLVLC